MEPLWVLVAARSMLLLLREEGSDTGGWLETTQELVPIVLACGLGYVGAGMLKIRVSIRFYISDLMILIAYLKEWSSQNRHPIRLGSAEWWEGIFLRLIVGLAYAIFAF